MVQLTEHFTLEECQKDRLVPLEFLTVLVQLLSRVVEPARNWAGSSFEITSTYRDEISNRNEHGQSDSKHIYTKQWAALDFRPQRDAREIFDWMRNNGNIPFHQLILEHGKSSTVVHVSIYLPDPTRRSVLEGSTHNATEYIKTPFVPFVPGSLFQFADLTAQDI